jgi:hypothetical protein
MTDRDQVERDLEQFAALAPTLGRHAEVEIFDPSLQATVVGLDAGAAVQRMVGDLQRDFGPEVKIRWVRVVNVVRRHRIRAAARARKARRGWR